MAKKKSSALLAVAYAAILFLFGMLLWLFWRGGTELSSYEQSVNFDTSLTGVMVQYGITSTAIVSQSQREMKQGGAEWVEISREVTRPEGFDETGFIRDLRKAAKAEKLTLEASSRSGGLTVQAVAKGRLLSRLVVSAPVLRPQSVTPRRVAIVIDDIGSRRDLSAFTGLGIPITFAVMPFERHSLDIARDLAQQKMPFILHLPLEPESYPKEDPGKAALFVRMTREEMEKKFVRDLATVPGVVGVSNHEGSRFSADEEKMKLLLAMVKEKGLFYFDSYTTLKTKAGKVARSLDLPFARNTLFLDLKDDHDFMIKQCDTLLRHAERHGQGIAIAHIQKKNIVPVLREVIPRFKKAGIEFVYLRDLIPANGQR